jgi:MFS family permease
LVVASVAWGIAGLGMGLSYAALSLIVLADASLEGQGVATSALQLSDVLGTALGTGVAGAVIAVAARGGEPAWIGLAGSFAVGATVGLLGLGLSARLGDPDSRTRVAAEAR